MPATRNRAEYMRAYRAKQRPVKPPLVSRLLQGVRDLTSNGRAQTVTQEDVDADGSVGQAVTVGRKLRAKVVL